MPPRASRSPPKSRCFVCAATRSDAQAASFCCAAGLTGQTIADKLADSNRPTWDQYKKDNEEALNISGTEIKNMIAYRQELDAAREQLYAQLYTQDNMLGYHYLRNYPMTPTGGASRSHGAPRRHGAPAAAPAAAPATATATPAKPSSPEVPVKGSPEGKTRSGSIAITGRLSVAGGGSKSGTPTISAKRGHEPSCA